MIRVLIYWHEYPVCATRIDALDELKYDVKVFSCKPRVPFREFNQQRYPPVYIDDSKFSVESFVSANPDVDILIITGWAHKVWLKIASYYKNRGAVIVMMVDNNLRYSVKQLLGSVVFRVLYNKLANYYLVPGIAASRLLRFYGVKSSKILRGYYGSTSSFFHPPSSGCEGLRNQAFVFVGQKNTRKGVDILTAAYSQYREKGGRWDLLVIGSGPALGNIAGIKEYSFMQPSDISEVFQSNIAFILPSRIDHWGTVVAEAASCGMILIVSSSVGAGDDLVFNGINGFVFDSCDVFSLANIMLHISSLDSMRLHAMSQHSSCISEMYREVTFADAICAIANASSLRPSGNEISSPDAAINRQEG
jgi:glycosyltransferase involved in cell wall biosynthesis